MTGTHILDRGLILLNIIKMVFSAELFKNAVNTVSEMFYSQIGSYNFNKCEKMQNCYHQFDAHYIEKHIKITKDILLLFVSFEINTLEMENGRQFLFSFCPYIYFKFPILHSY